MAQKLNITIPDYLHARLQKVKDRFNVSGVCANALRKRVQSEVEAIMLRSRKREWQQRGVI